MLLEQKSLQQRTMQMTDIKYLRAKSQEFIELGKKITQGEWDIDLEDGFVMGTHTNGVALVIRPSTRDANGYSVCSRASAIDWEALNMLPEFFAHIAELQKRIDDYEARVERLTEYASGRFTSDQS